MMLLLLVVMMVIIGVADGYEIRGRHSCQEFRSWYLATAASEQHRRDGGGSRTDGRQAHTDGRRLGQIQSETFDINGIALYSTLDECVTNLIIITNRLYTVISMYYHLQSPRRFLNRRYQFGEFVANASQEKVGIEK